MRSAFFAGFGALTLGVLGAWAQNASTSSAAPSASTADNGQFIDKEMAGEFRAPKLIGVSVYDNNKKSVGKISDLLLDKDGRVKAVVINIGGFLGIGAKDIAVPYSAVHWETEQRKVLTGPDAVTGNPASPVGGTQVNGSTPGTSGENAVNGVNGSVGNGAGMPEASGPVTPKMGGAAPGDQTRTATIDAAQIEAYQGYPDRAMIDMSQAQLKSAPEFKYASNPAASAMGAASGNGTMTPSGTTNATKP